MNLSEHFTLEELTVTQTGHANVPDAAHKVELVRLCNTVLEPMRALLGVPITIDSGFRSPEVNAAIPGSAAKSQHMAGQAADTVPHMDLEEAFQKIKASNIPYDQLILEPGWIHISEAPVTRPPRRQTLRMQRDAEGHPHYGVY